MKTYEEMAQNVLERINNYKTEQKKRRKTVARIAIPAVSFCLVLLCIGAWQSGFFKTKAPSANSDHATSDGKNGSVTTNQNTDVNKTPNTQIFTGDDGQKGSGTDNATCIFWWKNKLNMDGTLYHAIEENPAGTFAVLAAFRPATANITSFSYEGKTLAEWAIEADNERILPEKMTQLLKEGDALKYGDALYKGGAPSGEKWAKSLYDERIAFYGKKLLDKYIINGDFLRDALEKDIASYNEQYARKGYKSAYHAYLETVLPAAESRLLKNGIKCKRATYMNNGLTFTVTPAELENLPLEDLENWTFYLASDGLKGMPNNETDAADLQIVN